MRCALALSIALVLGAACATPSTPAPSAPATADASPTALPELLEALEPSPVQRAELVLLLSSLEEDLAPVQVAVADFGRALARAARRCRQDSPFIAMEADHTVTVGEQARGKALEAINRLHAILTPAQRQQLSRRLQGRETEAERAREKRDASRTRSIGGDLDLSIGQILKALVRVQKIRSDFEEKAAPWRERYLRAVRDFEREDFDVRDHAIADLPIVALMTDVARDAFRVLIPLLRPEQCEALARIIEDTMSSERSSEPR